MFSKVRVFLFFFILQLINIHAVVYDDDTDVTICVSCARKIRYEIFTKMRIQTQGLWEITPKDQNIQFFPILDTISNHMALIKFYYEYELDSIHPKDTFLQQPYELACLLDKLQQYFSVKLRFRTALFYNKKKINEEYLYDIKSYYHTQTHEIASPNNLYEIQTLIRNWMSANTKGRKIEKEIVLTPGVTNPHTIALQYTACWDTMNYVYNKDLLLFTIGGREKRRTRRDFSIANFPTLNFDNVTKLYVNTFTSRERIGYCNNRQLGFEAVRLPYKYGEFAMAILLPYENRSLDMFVNFSPDDYLGVFKYLSKNYENIHYVIPILNLTMVSINENGTSINTDEPVNDCGLRSSPKNLDFLVVNSDYKPFIVNRSFGISIYHEATKFVLWQAWVRDPTSNVYVPRKFSRYANSRSEEFERTFIS